MNIITIKVSNKFGLIDRLDAYIVQAAKTRGHQLTRTSAIAEVLSSTLPALPAVAAAITPAAVPPRSVPDPDTHDPSASLRGRVRLTKNY